MSPLNTSVPRRHERTPGRRKNTMGDFYAVNDNRMEGGARRLLREVLVPQAEKLDGGDIAVVVFEPGNACQRAARAAGWE